MPAKSRTIDTAAGSATELTPEARIQITRIEVETLASSAD